MVSLLVSSRRCAVLLTSLRGFSTAAAAGTAIKHIVMFGIQDHVSTAEISGIRQALLDLPKQIPLIRSYELGEDLLLPEGQKHPAGPNRRLCWSCEFASVADFDAYQAHEAHQAFLQVLQKVVLPGSRAAIQYRVDE